MKDMKENRPEEYSQFCKDQSMKMMAVWDSYSDEEKKERINARTDGIRNYFSNLSADEKIKVQEKAIRNLEGAGDALQCKLKSDPEFNEWFCSRIRSGWTNELREKRGRETREFMLNRWISHGDEMRAEHKMIQVIDFTNEMFKSLCEFTKGKSTHECKIDECCEFMNKMYYDDFVFCNSHKNVPNFDISSGFTPQVLRSLVKRYGYENWVKFRKNGRLQNHRITSIEYLEEKIEVGTLTIDGQEKYHD